MYLKCNVKVPIFRHIPCVVNKALKYGYATKSPSQGSTFSFTNAQYSLIFQMAYNMTSQPSVCTSLVFSLFAKSGWPLCSIIVVFL